MDTHKNRLCDMVAWAHELLAEVLVPGDLAIDLTAGRGHDTLWLAQQVDAEHSGIVLAFDIQQRAIASTRAHLSSAGYSAVQLEKGQNPGEHGVYLFQCCHSQLAEHLQLVQNTAPAKQLKVVIANFGYLPGSDHATTTTAATSCAAIEPACQHLANGGRIALVLYTGHNGAHEECEAIEAMCNQLPAQRWNVVRFQPVNRTKAPYLLLLEKKN
ncbi:MAG: hypothetical protein B6I36_06040 [Desulfobacteraceae bacterium 4572_35.1]|nr:MAG: hypothetical protein B6I36_06040 [Desulfobacteraceae bacterium 4572_35.1]